MKLLKQDRDLPAFMLALERASQRILLLDYDGTLAPFQIERDRAVPYDGVQEIIDHIIASDKTRVVIISGRAIKDLKTLLALKENPEIWGSHGWERLMSDGTYQADPINDKVSSGLIAAKAFAAAAGLQDLCEQKPACLALHWRGLKESAIQEIQQRVKPEWSLIAKDSGLMLCNFDGGIELRAPAKNKGHAVKTIMTESPPQAAMAYLGDDETDEDAFHTLGSRGLSILVRRELRTTAADIWLVPPQELLFFLKSWQKACER